MNTINMRDNRPAIGPRHRSGNGARHRSRAMTGPEILDAAARVITSEGCGDAYLHIAEEPASRRLILTT